MNDLEKNPVLESKIMILSLELSRQFIEIDLNIINSGEAAEAVIQAYCSYCRKMLELKDLPPHYHSYFKLMLSDLANYHPHDVQEAYNYLGETLQQEPCNGAALVGMLFYFIGDMIFKNNLELGALRTKYEHASQSDKSIITKEISRIEIKILKLAIIQQHAKLVRYYVIEWYRDHYEH